MVFDLADILFALLKPFQAIKCVNFLTPLHGEYLWNIPIWLNIKGHELIIARGVCIGPMRNDFNINSGTCKALE